MYVCVNAMVNWYKQILNRGLDEVTRNVNWLKIRRLVTMLSLSHAKKLKKTQARTPILIIF